MKDVALGAVRTLGRIVFALGGARWVIRRTRRRPRVMLYHACEPEESAFLRRLRSNTPPETFARQLDFLTEYYTVTDLETALSEARPDAAVAITFDDGYRSVHTHAFPALAERGLPACVYLISTAVGDGKMVWVNELARMLEESEAVREAAAWRAGVNTKGWLLRDVIHEMPTRHVSRMMRELAEAAGVDRDAWAREANLFLTEDHLAEMASRGITFGNHSTTHPNLAQCREDGARRQVRDADAALRHVPGFVASFAFPFGYLSEPARDEARKLGYASAMEVGGVNDPLDPMAVARQPVQAETPAELFAEMEFVEPFKAWVRRRMGG